MKAGDGEPECVESDEPREVDLTERWKIHLCGDLMHEDILEDSRKGRDQSQDAYWNIALMLLILDLTLLVTQKSACQDYVDCAFLLANGHS